MRHLVVIIMFFSASAVAQSARPSVEEFFNKATFENMDEVCREFYAENVRFKDPLGSIEGIEPLIKYYKNLYENVTSIKFEAVNTFDKGEDQVFVWRMHLRHKRLSDGELVTLDGTSHLRYVDGKVVYHRDYFDAGAMLYENIPILGRVIRWIKENAHSGQE